MKLKELTDEQLEQKRESIIAQIKKAPEFSYARVDLYKALHRVDAELARRGIFIC